MSADVIVVALLRANPLVVQQVEDRIEPGPFAQAHPLPALAFNVISDKRRNTLSNRERQQLYRARVQVTVLARNYGEQKALLKLVHKACAYRRGYDPLIVDWAEYFADPITLLSVLPDIDGPDMRDDDAGVYMQTTDFIVAYAT